MVRFTKTALEKQWTNTKTLTAKDARIAIVDPANGNLIRLTWQSFALTAQNLLLCKQQGSKLRYTSCCCLGACHCPLWQPCNCSSHCVGILQVGDWYPVTNLVTTLNSCCHVMSLHMHMHTCTAAAVMSLPFTCSLEPASPCYCSRRIMG